MTILAQNIGGGEVEVMILKDDKRIGIMRGEIYKARRYHLDPHEKVSLIERISDGYEPCCNEYIYNVAIKMQGRWMTIDDDNCYVPLSEIPEPPK